jgi:WD40 repeat protein
MARWIAGIGLLIVTVAAIAASIGNEEALRIEPKGTVSLEYPNKWDINKLIALSNDGSRLLDASEAARNIRVWDWEKNEVVQRLLLNEKAPEINDGKQRWEMVLQSSLGQELALSPDGQMVAACTRRDKGEVRVWNLENGAIVADIPGLQRHVPGLDQEMIFGLSCGSISFSPDGKYMAILVKSGAYNNNEADYTSFKEIVGGSNLKTKGFKNGMSYAELRAQKYYPVHISGIGIFETHGWKLERFFYRISPEQIFNSRPLFDPESKTVSAVLFDSKPPKPSRLEREWAGNRIVRWDITSGAQLEEKNMPQLAASPSVGVWWTPLPGGREVWWQNGFHQPPTVNDERTLYQTDAGAEQCRLSPVPVPTYESDVISNCAYIWVLTVLNLDTGKLKYLAPFKKNSRPVTGTQEQFYWAKISPDGAHVALFHKTENINNRLSASSSVEVHNMETWKLEGRYSNNIRFEMDSVFSSDSRYLAFSINKSRDWVKSALIFELPKKK